MLRDALLNLSLTSYFLENRINQQLLWIVCFKTMGLGITVYFIFKGRTIHICMFTIQLSNEISVFEKVLLCSLNFKEDGCIFMTASLPRTQLSMELFWPQNSKLLCTPITVNSLRTSVSLPLFREQGWMGVWIIMMGQCIITMHWPVLFQSFMMRLGVHTLSVCTSTQTHSWLQISWEVSIEDVIFSALLIKSI